MGGGSDSRRRRAGWVAWPRVSLKNRLAAHSGATFAQEVSYTSSVPRRWPKAMALYSVSQSGSK